MSAKENAGNKEARQESAAEPEVKDDVMAEGISAEALSESGREAGEPEEDQNAGAVRITDKRRVSPDGEPLDAAILWRACSMCSITSSARSRWRKRAQAAGQSSMHCSKACVPRPRCLKHGCGIWA